jgi:hypothetical protein
MRMDSKAANNSVHSTSAVALAHTRPRGAAASQVCYRGVHAHGTTQQRMLGVLACWVRHMLARRCKGAWWRTRPSIHAGTAAHGCYTRRTAIASRQAHSTQGGGVRQQLMALVHRPLTSWMLAAHRRWSHTGSKCELHLPPDAHTHTHTRIPSQPPGSTARIVAGRLLARTAADPAHACTTGHASTHAPRFACRGHRGARKVTSTHCACHAACDVVQNAGRVTCMHSTKQPEHAA